MKNLFFTIILMFLFSGITFSQSLYDVKTAADFYDLNSYQRKMEMSTGVRESKIQGSPYLNDEFISGSVFTTSKTQFTDVPLRYNIYNDNIEFKQNNNPVQELANPEIVEKVEFGDYKFVYIPYSDSRKTDKGFFNILEEGKATLYQKPLVIFEEAKATSPYQDAKPARFDRKSDEYYIGVENGEAKKIDSKKDLPDLFPDHKKEVETFIKKKKVKPNDEESLVELVKYYNSL